MNKPPFASRMWYWFDKTMARGTAAVIGLLALGSLAWILLAGLIAWAFGLKQHGEGYGYTEAT